MDERCIRAVQKAVAAAGGRQQDLATALGLHRSTVANWMAGRGRPSPWLAMEMAERYGLKVEHMRPEVAPLMRKLRENA